MQPQLPIEVDAESGVWTTDKLPMLYDAGHKSAYYWCEKEARQHDLSGLDVYQHYLKRLSQRGWGLFSFTEVDAANASASIKLLHSSFVLQQPEAHGKLCYMFAGWFAGAMDWVSDTTGNPRRSACSETQCGGEGHAHCVFTVTPLSA